MINIFEYPKRYLSYLWKIKVPENHRKSFDGKSMTTVWLTRLCNANCTHCFSRPPKKYDKERIKEYQFSFNGIKKLIQFINDSNCAYLMISGGGEPMFYKEAIFEIVENINAEKVVIVTNGIWGYDYYSAKELIDKLYQRLSERKTKCELVLRISVDKFHAESLGTDMIPNIFDVFRREYPNDEAFHLMFHSIIGDNTMEKVALKMSNVCLEEIEIPNSSDSNKINKIIPKKRFLRYENFCVPVGYAKLFYPDFTVDINNTDVGKMLKIFDEDIINSEKGNPALTFNNDGTVGLDFWIKYNGNVTTWGNQISEENYNIYLDSYDKVKTKTLDNILSYSFLDKGYFYRENIISEVNHQAVIRSKVIQLRNYSSALLLEEDCTKLYYGIRVIQDYLSEGILKPEDLKALPYEMQKVLTQDKKATILLYKQADYDIIDQYCQEKKSQEEWDMLFMLIKNGHYSILPNHINRAINYYNQNFEKKISTITDVDVIEYGKFQERLSHIRKEVAELFDKTE